jgi:hypothetical protein
MADTGSAALRRALDGPVPKGLRSLSDDELAHLAQAIDEARRRQARALASGGETALQHVPRLLRGPIRRVTG